MLRTTRTTISLCVVSPTTTDRLSVFTRIYRPKSCRQSVTFSVRCRICEKWMHRLCERHSVGFTVSLSTFTSVHRNVYFFSPQNVISRNPYPEDPNLVEVKFATTPIMSTYLVAFVIGEYDFVEGQSSDGITVRVYTPVGKAEQGKFALEVSSPPKVTSDRCNNVHVCPVWYY